MKHVTTPHHLDRLINLISRQHADERIRIGFKKKISSF